MAKKKQSVPEYGTVTRKGTLYYRTRITDADGKQVSLYATTCEELYEKQLEARRQVEEIIFHRKHPTVAEYCEKWLLMQSAKVSTATIKGYRQNMKNYVISSLGDMYMEEVTADDIRLALVPLSQKSKGLYDTVNMLICALPGFVDSKNEEKTERNAGYLVVSHSGGGMLRQGTRKGIRRTPANRGMRAHRIVKSLDISEDVCHGLCP